MSRVSVYYTRAIGHVKGQFIDISYLLSLTEAHLLNKSSIKNKSEGSTWNITSELHESGWTVLYDERTVQVSPAGLGPHVYLLFYQQE